MEFPQLNIENVDGSIVVLTTSLGDIKVKLFDSGTPKTVENFLTHAKNGYYDDVPFHRVIKDFMIQTGDPQGTGMGGESIWGGSFEDEFSNQLFNFRGALSMANAGPNTNGSQFFIVQAHQVPAQMDSMLNRLPDEIKKYYLKNGGTPWLDGKHTVFGQVIAGMDVVDKIAQSKVDMYDAPVNKIEIKSMKMS
ncbi:peptidylprolyl isomerase [Convivina praedatoris]|uniref:Peptidyl-prolyl cis-trans isomerase n=1 Tax=Convivina praedatoris TaxID=2880963 RepID=A0ABN8H8J1_9LACO|nr:peptidylprolyl isomerase [Convivina sp. LMG 32447]CAH1852745.1 Putative peptidyl-prolyl cis-trans isomerase [Convivina sp. LMG 32447]CAH1852774.1 Putative peptidyl-prolyl cis-trans isomerase [Convivina sp. LMG 32447]CAH1854778.1 Putative peptidyl-prolyl cis-trans isomerase [Convivina sp. LMG 32447]